jgi:EpsI family protein
LLNAGVLMQATEKSRTQQGVRLAGERVPRSLYAAALAAALLLLLSDRGYQVLEQRFSAFAGMQVMPKIPFEYFPRSIGGWEGQDVPISETVLKIAANDDYVCRRYYHAEKQLSASLYIAYTGQPQRMLGHRPQVCYVGSGWTHDGSRQEGLTTPEGRELDVLVHRFSKKGLAEQHIWVLNYYVVNGLVTSDHGAFSGLKWRRPQVRNGRAGYVAQVQISSTSEQAASALSDQILFHLP